jgi:hypothetical protein
VLNVKEDMNKKQRKPNDRRGESQEDIGRALQKAVTAKDFEEMFHST